MKIFILAAVILTSSLALGQTRNRVDLDDLMIKGELRNDDRLMILAREKNQMKNYIKFRTNYREEMLQELPEQKKLKHY